VRPRLKSKLVPGSGLELEPEVVMNNSPSNLEKTQRGPGGRVKHWDHRQNAGVMEAPGSNVRKDSSDEPKWTHQEPAEAMG